MKSKIPLIYRTMNSICRVVFVAGILALFLTSPSTAIAVPGDLQSEIHKLNIVSSDERWRIFADMQKDRGDPGVVAFNQKIYVMGGYFPSFYGYNLTQEVYDPQNDTWQYRANLPIGRSDMMVAAIGDKFYAVGGWNTNLGGALGYNQMYDPVLDNWTTMTSLITPVSGAGVVVLNNTIYILGGFDNINSSGIVQKYDQVGNGWSLGTPMPAGKSEFGAILLNGKIYAIGGVLNNGITTNTVEIYDPVTDLWTEGPPLPESRASMAVEVRQGRIYVIGGTDDWAIGNPKNTAFVFDPVLGVWSTVYPMPTSRRACRAAVINDIIYVIGGVGDPGAGSANEGFGYQPVTSTTTIISDNPEPSQANQPFNVSYSVTAAGENPTGVVTVTVDNRPENCSGSLINGQGSCQLTLNALGPYTITATYGGNNILLGSSDKKSHSVVKSDTNTIIDGGNPNPSLMKQPFMVTFTVTSPFGTPTGLVTVNVGNNSETCSGVLANGIGNCSINLPIVGIYTLIAEYDGDATFNPSSDTKTHTVELFKLFLPTSIRG